MCEECHGTGIQAWCPNCGSDLPLSESDLDAARTIHALPKIDRALPELDDEDRITTLNPDPDFWWKIKTAQRIGLITLWVLAAALITAIVYVAFFKAGYHE